MYRIYCTRSLFHNCLVVSMYITYSRYLHITSKTCVVDGEFDIKFKTTLLVVCRA